MINEAHISLSGYVATQPFFKETRTGIPSLTMRVAWTPRRMDRVTGEWVDAGTSFLSVACYRKLAENAATCLRKGDPVVVRGRVSVRDFEDKNGLQRTTVEVDATSVGHDLSRGVATFQRVRPQTGMTAMELRAAEEGIPGGSSGEALGSDVMGAGVMGSAALGSGVMASDDPDDPGDPGRPGGEMFDDDAAAGFAQEAASAAAPF